MLPLAIFLFVGVLAPTFADEPEAIVGGTPAAPGEFPYQVSLNYQGSHVCGGSIIAPTKILTAAHCVDFIRNVNLLLIKTGSIYSSSGEVHAVKYIRMHPSYDGQQSSAWKCDVAVITLQRPIQYNQNQAPITVATSQPSPSAVFTLAGWGMTRANGPTSQILLKMNQSFVSLSQCQQAHRSMPMSYSHLCTLNRRGIGACQGDSGGPLVANGIQYGITSWVAPCGLGLPDVYTNVANFVSFIQSA
ncbi:hypothetical protein ACFW04_008549 [Cataglyphis niger]